MPELDTARIAQYLDTLVPPRPAVMGEMEADAAVSGFPIIGPAAGHLCYLLARMTGARTVFEMGSGFGYSTAWFARAVKENGGGTVHHVVWDEGLSQRARGHLEALGLDDVVEYHVAEAVETLQATSGPFDIIFNDIDKQAYPASLPLIASRLRPGGLLIIDNLLWHGRIFDPADTSPATQGVRDVTRMLQEDPDWTWSLIPVRDGVGVAWRR
jgi:caffeoyl-CoA O-methyltransferase